MQLFGFYSYSKIINNCACNVLCSESNFICLETEIWVNIRKTKNKCIQRVACHENNFCMHLLLEKINLCILISFLMPWSSSVTFSLLHSRDYTNTTCPPLCVYNTQSFLCTYRNTWPYQKRKTLASVVKVIALLSLVIHSFRFCMAYNAIYLSFVQVPQIFASKFVKIKAL